MQSGAQANLRSPSRDGGDRSTSTSSRYLKWLQFFRGKRQISSPTEADTSEFRVFVLGTRGSGKTVLLSAIHQRLLVQSPEIGFYLEVSSDRDRIFLTQQFDQIADPDQPWPLGTTHDEIKEFGFQCVHSSERGRIPLFSFTYIDYPGGLVTDLPEGEDEDRDFVPATAAENADAVVALLDGQKILHHMRGDVRRSKGLDRDLRYLIPNLTRLEWKTVHFVVTKWDILEQEYSFEEVREALLKNINFRKLAEQRKDTDKPIHLIPVSAVGRDFAMLDNKQVMRKRQNGGNAEPFLVEMTIAMTMTDAFLVFAKSLDLEERNTTLHPKYLLRIPIFLGRFTISLLQGVGAVTLLPAPFGLKKSLASMVLAALDDKLEDQGQKLKLEAEAAFKRIEDQRTALEAVFMKQAALRVDFERSFPLSDLTRS